MLAMMAYRGSKNHGLARAPDDEAMVALDNVRTVIMQACNSLTLFREWLSSGMPFLLKIFYSIVGQYGKGGTLTPSPRLSIKL